jgi:hypothetical protein
VKGLRKTTAKAIPVPVEHHRGSKAKYGRSGEAKFSRTGGGGVLAKPTQWWFGKEAQCGSPHQPHGTLPQSGHIPVS